MSEAEKVAIWARKLTRKGNDRWTAAMILDSIKDWVRWHTCP